jgi:hypothetical protein
MKKYLLSSGAAIALLAIALPAQASERRGFQFGTVSLSLGLGLGTVEADTWGSKANATTKNTYNATASASVTPPEEEEEPVLTSVEENGAVHRHRPVLSTSAHADVTNESSTDVKGYAYARSGGLAIGAGWGAILLLNKEGIFGTTNRSAAIAGGLSGSESYSEGKASASGTGTGNATADATNDSETGQTSSSSATGGGTASASSSGKNGYSSASAGGASVGVGATY